MRKRQDPLVPILGSAVAVVVLGAIVLVFVPRISRWFGPDEAFVTGETLSPASRVPVWVCRGVEGVALLLESRFDAAAEKALDAAFDGGAHHYLTLTVYNFARSEPFVLTPPVEGMPSPEGGPPAVPAFLRLRADLPAHLAAVVLGLGAAPGLRVERGHMGHLLLALDADPEERGAFACGALIFERRVVARRFLAAWQRRPDLKGFLEF